MTNNNSDRLDKIEALVASNARAIQAMVEQQSTFRLEHEENMAVMRDAIVRLATIQDGMGKWITAIDDNQPTILRKLNTIENKLDTLLKRD